MDVQPNGTETDLGRGIDSLALDTMLLDGRAAQKGLTDVATTAGGALIEIAHGQSIRPERLTTLTGLENDSKLFQASRSIAYLQI